MTAVKPETRHKCNKRLMSWSNLRHAMKRTLYPFVPAPIQGAIDRTYYKYRLLADSLADEPELGALDRMVEPGAAVADIGANLGAYALELSRIVGPGGKVLAFEPIPRTANLLTHFVKRLAPHRNVGVINAAVGEFEGTTEMFLPREGRLANFYVASLLPIHSGPASVTRVRITTLDTWRKRIDRRISFVKIDTEGAELMVLQGAETMIMKDRPVLLCEIGDSDRGGLYSASDVEEWLIAHRYRLHQWVNGKLELSSTAKPLSSSRNYFAIPD